MRETTSFGDVPVQPSSSFVLRAVQQTVDVPLAEVFVNPYPDRRGQPVPQRRAPDPAGVGGAAGVFAAGAYHGAELMYAYGTLGAAGDAEYTAADLRLSERMTDHWVRFAATGDPNGPGLPRCPSVAGSPNEVMELGERCGIRPRPRAAAVDFWLRHPGPIA